MKLEREDLLRRFHARDARNDGLFVVGVVTTGIYCLPSCPAKKPRSENVRFFADEEGALQAGLRACKRCRPDRFYRRHDPDRERLAELAARVRSAPADLADARDLARASGFGATKLNQLFRRHYHTTPASFLARARLEEAARRLVETGDRVLDVAISVGFESQSTFHENFRRHFGLAPRDYRRLSTKREFELALPEGFRRDDVFGLFSRDAAGLTERVDGRTAAKALRLDDEPCRLGLAFAPRRVRVVVHARGRPSRRAMIEAHARVARMLGLGADPGPFERRVRRTRGLARLIRGRAGLRIPLTPDAFEGLVWVIVGQQVNVTFASVCRNRLIELAGEPVGDGFVTHPTPAAVARLDYADLERRQFSRRKAEYLIDTARRIAAGELDLEGLAREPAGRIEETLGGVRGLGPWSIQYLLMRSYGLEDCVPIGDAGLVLALQRFFELSDRPDADETLRLMEPFAPHRSLATFHLWKTLGEEG